MTDAKEHSIIRRIFAQDLSKTSMTRFESQMRIKAKIAISKIKRDASAGNADVLKWFPFMATDVMGELSFGSSFNMLEQETKTPFRRDLETTMGFNGIRAELKPLVGIAQYLAIRAVQNALDMKTRMAAYTSAAIEDHKQHIMIHNDWPGLFSKFLDPTKNQELFMSEVVGEAANFIVARNDTTAVSLTYPVWSVLRRQNCRVQQGF
ncbi:uncharacterized protein A1O9_03965 [Exophiala aquamarina CBS 119918]|uniref:Uncharacterized protein n=1 Tax=Exophiala aquamarina CBS 119918 TaxID=1182545 RepID=A0A072PGX6_9EURO|nr:uncharacterized protein A1O9_03965 [Exophiala aquamarina CBS 119918]KEF59121.1 hypothetical protein A1O9_03965 [Exophiala aquamarina CBS 119918]